MTSTHESAPDFDASMLADLERSLPSQDFRAFIEEYLISAADRLHRAEAIIAAGDMATLATEAHILISTAGSYGFKRASALARQLESACKAGDAGQAKTLLQQLCDSSRRAFSAMRERFLAASG